MIRLDSTVRSLEIVLAGAVATTQPVFTASWSDATASGYTGGATPGTLNGATPVTAVASPAASTVRDIDYLSINNLDTDEIVVTVQYNDNASVYPIITTTIAAGSHLNYTHAHGWEVLDSAGRIQAGVIGPIGATGTPGVNAPAMFLDIPEEQDERAISLSGVDSTVHIGPHSFKGLVDLTGSSAGQIAFPTVQNPSSNVTTLDDYREGSWTPSITFGGAGVGVTYAVRLGQYIKIGKNVSLWLLITLTSKGVSTGAAKIEGLPFPASDDGILYGGGLPYFDSTVAVISAGCGVQPGASVINLYNLPGALITDANIANNTTLIIGVSYKASA